MTGGLYPPETDGAIPIPLPSGAIFNVLTQGEAEFLHDKIHRYLTDNHFVNVADMLDIDKMIVFELLIHRWTLWLSRGQDYFGEEINFKTYADMANNYSTEVRQLKKALGVDKNTRDKTRGDDSIPALWDNLLRRAREFGYMRNEQFYAVITAFHRIKAMITLYENTDAVERKENACELDDVIAVIKDEIARFDAIDESFRFEKQAAWVRQQ